MNTTIKTILAIAIVACATAAQTTKGKVMVAAADKNKTALVLKTIRAGVDTNDMRTVNEYGETVLIIAARNGNLQLAQALLSSKAVTASDVTVGDRDGNTAMMYAVNNKDANMIKLLAARYSEDALNQMNANKESAISYAKKIGGEVASLMESVVDTAHKATLVQISAVQSDMPVLVRGK